jgi:dCTP deaminase
VILSDSEIHKARNAGSIVIEPFDLNAMGGNSYDVHLGSTLFEHGFYQDRDRILLDCKVQPHVEKFTIPTVGYVLRPGMLYLASTVEYTETHEHVPYLDGKSSVGRLGISIHATAGRGDVGFCNHWTMELSVIHPVRVYAGMPIGQLTFHTVLGEVLRNYGAKPSAKYTSRSADPQPSSMWKNFKE